MATTQEQFDALQNLGVSLDAADAYFSAKRWENAVSGYQSFGSDGVAFGAGLNASDPSIVQASSLNSQLQALASHLASPQTAQQANTIAHQMLPLYQAAYNAAPFVATPAGPMAPGTAPTTVAAPVNGTAVAKGVLWGLVALGLGFLVVMLWRAPPRMPLENPMRGPGGTKKTKRPIVKGRSCRFEMKDGPDVTCVGAMIHDPTGRAWPKNSVLCGPFRARVRRATDDEYRGASRDYLGTTHQAYIGVVDMPPRALGEWDYLGEVDRIFYTRTGKKRPGRYQHPFFKPTALATLIRGRHGKVRLYRRGRFCRLELPRGAMLDSRGFVYP